LQPVIRRVVDAGLEIFGDDHAGRDVAARIGRRVVQRRKQRADIDAARDDALVDRRVRDAFGRNRIGERATDERADRAEIDAECGLAVFLRGEKISDDRNLVPADVGKQQSWTAVQPFHQARHFEVPVDRRGVGLQPSALDHARERRAKIRVDRRYAAGRVERCGHSTAASDGRDSSARS
jgi:hypothetical protein